MLAESMLKKTSSSGLFWKPDASPEVDLTDTGGTTNTVSNVGTSGVWVDEDNAGVWDDDANSGVWDDNA